MPWRSSFEGRESGRNPQPVPAVVYRLEDWRCANLTAAVIAALGASGGGGDARGTPLQVRYGAHEQIGIGDRGSGPRGARARGRPRAILAAAHGQGRRAARPRGGRGGRPRPPPPPP